MTAVSSSEQGALLGLLENLLANSPLGFCFLDDQLRYVCVNDPFARMNGSAPSQLLGRTLREETTEFALMAETALRRVLKTGKPVLDFELNFPSSSTRSEAQFALASFYPVLGNSGNVASIGVMILDITERKATDIRIKQSEERYRLLFDHSPDPIFVLRPETNRFLAVNEAAMRIYGYSKKEFLAMNARQLRSDTAVPAFLTECSPPDPVIESKRLHEGECQHRKKDGNTIDVEMHCSPISFRGNEAHLVLAHDITERSRDERKFRGLLESAPDAMVIVNGEGTIVLLNAQTEILFGYRREELLGKKLEVLIPKRYAGGHPAHRNLFFKSAKARPMGAGLQLYAVRKDGTEFPVEISLAPLETPEGLLISSAIRDVTEKRRADDKLKVLSSELTRSNTALTQFASIASHDLREPVRTIGMFIKLLKKKNADKLDSESLEYMDFITDGANRMGDLINDLLRHSEVGAKCSYNVTTDLNSILNAALRNLKVACDESHTKVNATPLPKVVCDPSQLGQLFQNLVANAIKYRSSSTPEIFISAQEQDKDWVFCVKDNGIGFEMKYAGKIFEQFQRLHGKGQYAGSGLGLATCQRIVQQHDGRIWAESEVGKGSSFYFSLPKIPNYEIDQS